MVEESVLRDVIINAGLTFSPENGDDYPLRQIPLNTLVKVVVDYLKRNDVRVIEDERYFGVGKKKYYLARANMFRQLGRHDLADSYDKLAGVLPWGGNDGV
jgi:hypothetical protein